MAVVFFGARPLTRVSSKTGSGADVISSLAAVVTVMPLYVLAHRSRSPLSLISGMSSQRPGAVKGAPVCGAAERTLDGEDRCGS